MYTFTEFRASAGGGGRGGGSGGCIKISNREGATELKFLIKGCKLV